MRLSHGHLVDSVCRTEKRTLYIVEKYVSINGC